MKQVCKEWCKSVCKESLLRCKSVCKEWYLLISDQRFIKTHYTLSSTNNINYEHHRLIYNTSEQRNNLKVCPLSNLMFDKSANNVLLLENPLQLTRSQSFRIVGSCNGLLCLLVIADNTLFIYNPSTRTTNIFPGSKQRACLCFVSYGFGYDETNHDYKLVKIGCCHRTSPFQGTMIYSLKAGSWKEIGRFPCVSPSTHGKFLNGALHWVSGDHWYSRYSRDIVSLDLGKETYGEVLQPEYTKGSKILTLGVFGEWLCVLCNYSEINAVDVWVMKVYGVKDSWTKLFSISRPNYPFSITSLLCVSYPEIHNFDEFLDTCIVVESLVSPFPPLGLADNTDDEN